MERETVEAARAGDPSAFDAVVVDFTPTVYAAAYGWCGDRHLAADITQEVFAIAFAKFETLREPAAIAGWLMAITRTASRRAGRDLAVVGGVERGVVPVEDEVIAAEDARRIRRAVEALPAEQRLPIVLHYFAGRPLGEVAELCALPLSTVKKRMRDARARLRRGGLELDVADASPMTGEDVRDAIRVFPAVRSGDTALVAALLDARPDLVDVRENWSREQGWHHGLLPTHGGTPLLRSVERGDRAMVELLLDRGADPDGTCACDGAEQPMWVAAVQGDEQVVEMLLARGADPSRAAFAGLTPIDVAAIRGHEAIVRRLQAAGGQGSPGVPASDAAPNSGAATGIKAIDLWCPLPERGLVHLHFAYGCGAMVLLCELSRRWLADGRRVTWTGFVPRSLDRGDIHHVLAEGGLSNEVTLAVTDHQATDRQRRLVFEASLARTDDTDVLVVFNEIGHRDAVEERLFDLAGRRALTVVVSTIDDPDLPRPGSGPYLASVRFDRERAERGRWPAISADSWSVPASPELADLAARARGAMNDELDAYLCQPFVVAAHVTAHPGESVSLAELSSEVTRRLATVRPSERAVRAGSARPARR